MQVITRIAQVLVMSSIFIAGCGGGGFAALSPGGGGIGGTGVTSTGTIDGFGSIFVNGVEYETGEASVTLDGESSGEGGLKLGMVVTVSGTVNEDGVTGTADLVVFDDDVEGPIDSIVPGPDGDSLLITVLGIEVIVERVSTVFDGVAFDTLSVGDLVEISGFVREQRFRATRVEKKSDFVAGVSEIELKGLVSELSGTEFVLGEFTVDYSAAQLSDIPGGSLANGMLVEVHGTLVEQRIMADEVEGVADPADLFDEDDEVSIQGVVTQFQSAAQLQVNGIAVDASTATLEPGGLILQDGLIVQVEGVWNGNVLVAREVESRRGRIEIEASVASVSTEDQAISLQLFSAVVTVVVDSQTLMDDGEDGGNPLTLTAISSGDFLEVEAIQVDDSLLATHVRREEPDDDVIQAQVESFNSGSDITLLGITYSTDGAEFESQNDEHLLSEAFYGQLQVGDLVKVKDDRFADGIADEVEFESETELDGDDGHEEDCKEEDVDEDCKDEGDDEEQDEEQDEEDDEEDHEEQDEEDEEEDDEEQDEEQDEEDEEE